MSGLPEFHDQLRAALRAADPLELFDTHDKDDGHLDDVAAYLSQMSFCQPEEKPSPSPPGRFGSEPIRNKNRNVGRNDPCPCGSGKKFKKCCLDKIR
jgi:preprotein translocase subunit SecA